MTSVISERLPYTSSLIKNPTYVVVIANRIVEMSRDHPFFPEKFRLIQESHTMITAKEAKNNVTNSDVTLQNFLENNFAKQIRELSLVGVNKYKFHIGAQETWKTISTGGFERRVVCELRQLGFMAEYGFHGEKYVPPGLRDDHDGSGPEYRNYGYIVSW